MLTDYFEDGGMRMETMCLYESRLHYCSLLDIRVAILEMLIVVNVTRKNIIIMNHMTMSYPLQLLIQKENNQVISNKNKLKDENLHHP